MEFSPDNPIVKLCLQAMALEEQGEPGKAGALFLRAWEEASADLEKFLAAFYVARHQKNISGKLMWFEKALHLALKMKDPGVGSALPGLYRQIAKCYEELDDPVNAKKNYEAATSSGNRPPDKGPFYHGTKADLKPGDMLTPGNLSNYKTDLKMNHIYFTALVNGAGLAAALAKGDARERIYIVEPTGPFENDPNVTDKKFPGNPTRSYRTAAPLRITGEVEDWLRTSPEEIRKWKEKLAGNKGDIIN
jgi:rifampin ADP-ribosylating transferase